MADSPFADIGGQIAETVFSSIIWFGMGFIVVALVGGLMWYFLHYKRQFNVRVLIRSDRAGEKFNIIEDKGGFVNKRVDKKKIKVFRILGLKKDLPDLPNWAIERTNKGDYIELLRKSEDELVPLKPEINRRQIVRIDGTVWPVAKVEMKQIEGDLAYWNLISKKDTNQIFSSEGWLGRLLPFLPQILGGVIIIFILYILLDTLPGILSQLSELTKELRSLKGAKLVTEGVAAWMIMKR